MQTSSLGFVAYTGIFALPLFDKHCSRMRKSDVNVHVIRRDGQRCIIQGKVGENLMYLLQRNNLEVEGACEASLACSTCHVYVSHPYFDKLAKAAEAEEDMLDQAVFLKENSRLCE
ncbi:unnamed protein product [Echinostoma caproni]|uniref:2Fe-2S ferredoxin-type domain-containing protein n=1 Tax=Echinostoma caproni TaxID=27848 RepID=A0A183A376_9TREM|nr:unnamed protein product [Echinostoma caproni]